VSELAHIARGCDWARPCLTDLGTLPLAVITSSEHDPSHTPGSPADHQRSLWYATWKVLQAELASLSRDSSHIIATRAGHHIHRDDPQLVTGVLRDLVPRARGRGQAEPTELLLRLCEPVAWPRSRPGDQAQRPC
jgi:hypothetical protein